MSHSEGGIERKVPPQEMCDSDDVSSSVSIGTVAVGGPSNFTMVAAEIASHSRRSKIIVASNDLLYSIAESANQQIHQSSRHKQFAETSS
jgi:hypothetical protein